MKIVTGKMQVDFPTPYNNLRELLDYAIKRYPENSAYIYRSTEKGNEGASVHRSYSELREDINYLGASLAEELGLDTHAEEKAHMSVVGANSYPWVVFHNAVMFGLGISVPLDKQLADHEAVNLCLRGKVSVLAFDYSHKDMAVLLAKENPQMKGFVLLDRPDMLASVAEELRKHLAGDALITSFGELIIKGTKLSQEKLDYFRTTPIDAKKMTAIYFTSGTTSQSKGVMLSQFNIIRNVQQGLHTLELEPGGRSLSVLPLHHTFEATIGYCLWGVGICICFNDSLRNLMNNMKEWKITIILTVPLMMTTIYRQIMKNIQRSGKEKKFNFGLKLSRFLRKLGIDKRRTLFKDIHEALGGHMDWFVSGAASLAPEIQQFFTDVGFVSISGYGLTETSPILAASGPDTKIVGSVGPPLCEVTLAIDSDSGGNSPETAGEILVKGDNVMLGYYENEEATRETFTSDGWLKTGDVGYFDKEGNLHITGRAKSCIVLSNGKNVFPEELESFFAEVPGVKNVMVWGEETARGAVDLAARFQIDREALPEEMDKNNDYKISEYLEKTIRDINSRMTEYKRINHFIWDESDMVMTTTLKVKRTEELAKIHAYLKREGKELKDVRGMRLSL